MPSNPGLARGNRPITAPCLTVFKIKVDSRMECPDNAALKKKQEEDLDLAKHLIFARACKVTRIL